MKELTLDERHSQHVLFVVLLQGREVQLVRVVLLRGCDRGSLVAHLASHHASSTAHLRERVRSRFINAGFNVGKRYLVAHKICFCYDNLKLIMMRVKSDGFLK